MVEGEVHISRSDQLLQLMYKPVGEMLAGSIDVSSIGKEGAFVYGIEGENVWYFNRLFVPVKLRNRGIASKLLEKLLEVMKRDGMTVVLEINPYGDLNLRELRELYMRYGFKKTRGEYLIYTPEE